MAFAGELNAGAEPGLILTPRVEATQDDDGYLSASEIATLELDADWVALSASIRRRVKPKVPRRSQDSTLAPARCLSRTGRWTPMLQLN
jgi:hypothetical protein